MVITLATTNLCDGPDRGTEKNCGPDGLTVNGRTIAQPLMPIRAAAATIFGRGNLITTLSFQVSRRYTTVASAAIYAATHPGSVVRTGTLTVTEGAVVKTMYNAHLEDVQCRHIGATVFITYKVSGGVLS